MDVCICVEKKEREKRGKNRTKKVVFSAFPSSFLLFLLLSQCCLKIFALQRGVWVCQCPLSALGGTAEPGGLRAACFACGTLAVAVADATRVCLKDFFFRLGATRCCALAEGRRKRRWGEERAREGKGEGEAEEEGRTAMRTSRRRKVATKRKREELRCPMDGERVQESNREGAGKGRGTKREKTRERR